LEYPIKAMRQIQRKRSLGERLTIHDQDKRKVKKTIDLDTRASQGMLNYQHLKMLLPWLEEYDDGFL
jgi:hypothetical protein